jgi:hypothetical protein
MKRYIAILNQNGTADPVAIVLENNLGNIVWTRGAAGEYLGTLSGAFQEEKTIGLIGDGQGGEESTETRLELPANSEDYVVVTTTDVTSESGRQKADGLLVRTSIEIVVY